MNSIQPKETKAEDLPLVLLIDDEQHIVTALTRELRSKDIVIVPFTQPEFALEASLLQEFALIISDNLMPGLTGLEILEQVKEHHPLTRRILLTGQTEQNRAIRAFNRGIIHRFVDKPWNKEELLHVIDEELEVYHREKSEKGKSAELEQLTRKQTGELEHAKLDLKKIQTQLFLLEDSAQADKFELSPFLRGASVVVVDEITEVNELLVDALRKVGIAKCESASNAVIALKRLDSWPPVDVVLSEWWMKSMDGLELFRAIRQGNTDSSKAIYVFVTTRENRMAVELAIKEGIDGYILKPFRLKTLLYQLEQLVQKTQKAKLQAKIEQIKSLRFVVANADLHSRSKIQSILLEFGSRNVRVTDSGRKALRILTDQEIDVLIYDCNLIDPYWMRLKEALDQHQRGHIPALVVTSMSRSQQEREEIKQANLTTYITMPISKTEFIQTILWAREEQRVRSTDEIAELTVEESE